MNIDLNLLNNWNSHIAKAAAQVGTEDFPDRLVDALKALIDFDICMVFAYGIAQGTLSLHHNMCSKQAKLLVDDYLLGPHLMDPFYIEAVSGRRQICRSMLELAPDEFHRSKYYRHHYIRTGIKDEIGIFFPACGERTAVLSVTRQQDRDFFSDEDKAMFVSVAPLVRALGANHWGADNDFEYSPSSHAIINDCFEIFGEDTLTHREREIMVLILKGYSSLSISHVLEIAEGTVKIHRKNAYRKLGITSQAGLVSIFLKTLEQRLCACKISG